jgi:hypothetical protein
MKKKVPIKILKELEPYVKSEYDFVKIRKKKDRLLSLVDRDIESDFFFELTKYEVQNSKLIVTILRKPKNELSNEEFTERVAIEHLKVRFESWLKIIESYENVDNYFDDPILKAYQNEFFESFKILDEDAETTPFEIKQQLAIEQHLNTIIDVIENEEESDESLEIIEESIKLKKDLGKLTKTETFNKMCLIWGKLRKYSFQTLKVIMTKGTEKLIEYSVTKGFEIFLDAIN